MTCYNEVPAFYGTKIDTTMLGSVLIAECSVKERRAVVTLPATFVATKPELEAVANFLMRVAELVGGAERKPSVLQG